MTEKLRPIIVMSILTLLYRLSANNAVVELNK